MRNKERNKIRDKEMMYRILGTAVGTLIALGVVPLSAQNPVIRREPPSTMRGEIVDISCYRAKGVSGGTGAAHIACAKECAAKGRQFGILTDGEGVFRLMGGDWEKNNYANLLPHIGQWVEIRGAEVLLSNSYDVRTFEIEKLTPSKRPD